MFQPILLGVNIDHVATLRQARGGVRYPDPVQAAFVAEQAGADGITVHLREDRRHIQDRDVEILAQTVQTRLNLEMAATPEMIALALRIKPTFCCIVPERRQELTTEGGLDVVGQLPMLKETCAKLKDAGILVSLFIDPIEAQIDATLQAGAPYIELHTGAYAEAADTSLAQQQTLATLMRAATYAHTQGLHVNAGHGLHKHNVAAIAAIPEIVELNIGHSLVAEAVFSGLAAAVHDLKQVMVAARGQVTRSRF